MRKIAQVGKEKGNSYEIRWAPESFKDFTSPTFGFYIYLYDKVKIPGYEQLDQYQDNNYYLQILQNKMRARFIDKADPKFITVVNTRQYESWSIFPKDLECTLNSWIEHGATDSELAYFIKYVAKQRTKFFEQKGVEAAIWWNNNGPQTVGHMHLKFENMRLLPGPAGKLNYDDPQNPQQRQQLFNLYNSKGKESWQEEYEFLEQ